MKKNAGLISRIKQVFTGTPQFNKGKSVGTTVEDLVFLTSARQRLDAFGDLLWNPYKDNPWVYASIEAIASNIANTDRMMVRKPKRPTDDPEVVYDNPIFDLLEDPNMLLEGNQLILGTLVFLEGWGEAFWLVERDNPAMLPDTIDLVPPSRVRPRVTTDGRFMGWEYRGRNLNPWDIVHFKLFNPDNPLKGLPRWASARLGIEQDKKAGEFNTRLFDDGSMLSGLVLYKGELSDSQFKRYFQEFNAPDSLGANATRVAILDNAEDLDFKHIPLNTDIKFGDLKKLSREEVFAVYKTNEVVLGLYNNVKSDQGQNDARRAWWQECLVPTIKYLQDVINKQFVWWIDRTVVLRWDLATVEALQEDFGEKLKHAKDLFGMGVPFNRINQRLGLGFEDFPWGDTGFLPMGLRPIDGKVQVIEIERGATRVSEPAQKALPSAEPKVEFKRVSKKSVSEVASMVLEIQESFEKKFESKFGRWLMGVRAEAKRNLHRLKAVYREGESKAVNEALVDKGLEEFVLDTVLAEMEYKKLMGPLYFEAIREGVKSVDIELGITVSGQFELTPAMQRAADEFLLTRLNQMTPVIVDTVKRNLVSTLKEGILAGESVGELTDRLRAGFNMTARRALTVARTESGSVVNGGRYLEMQAQGVKFHEWVTAGDDAVRDSHSGVEGEVVEIGATFSNGLRFPHDPLGPAEEVVNCRCVALAAEKK